MQSLRVKYSLFSRASASLSRQVDFYFPGENSGIYKRMKWLLQVETDASFPCSGIK